MSETMVLRCENLCKEYGGILFDAEHVEFYGDYVSEDRAKYDDAGYPV